jgi:hypothetical protein
MFRCQLNGSSRVRIDRLISWLCCAYIRRDECNRDGISTNPITFRLATKLLCESMLEYVNDARQAKARMVINDSGEWREEREEYPVIKSRRL